MSKSTRLPIIKAKYRNWKATILFRRVRRRWRTIITSSDPSSIELPDSRAIVNDYDYCDYTFDLTNNTDAAKYKRK